MTTLNDIYHAVREINARTRSISEAARAAEQAPTACTIPGGLGTVMVDGLGTLVSVNLERHALTGQTSESLANQLLHTIQQAETDARNRRNEVAENARTQRSQW